MDSDGGSNNVEKNDAKVLKRNIFNLMLSESMLIEYSRVSLIMWSAWQSTSCRSGSKGRQIG